MSWDILPKENLQYFLQKLKGKFDGKADNSDVTEVDTSNTTPFLYRQTPYNADGVFLDELVGGSVAWNQLAGANARTVSNYGISVTWDSVNKKYSVTGTGNANTPLLVDNITLPANRKVLLINTNSNIKVYFNDSSINGQSVISASTNGTNYFGIYVEDGKAYSGTFTLMCIDLTQMFGTTIADYIYSLEQATAGSGIAWLKSHGFFTKDYYPYNTGELISVKTSGKKYVGKNRFDTNEMDNDSGTVGVGTYDGQISHIPSTMFANYPFKANTQYTLSYKGKNTTTAQTNFRFVINYTDGTSLNVGNVQTSEYVSISGTSASGKTIQSIGRDYSTGGSISLKDLMFEEGSTATAYESYTETTYDISNIDLRGIPKLVNNELVYDGDTYESDGNVTRKYGIVDLGSLSWYFDSSSARMYSDVISAIKPVSSNTNTAKVMCYKYIATSVYNQHTRENKTVGISTESRIYVYDTTYTDATTFKTAMNGVYLVYELTTPTTETVESYQNPQICDKDGTEEFIDDRTVPIPVGHNSRYADLPAIMDGDYLSYMARNFASEEYVDWEIEAEISDLGFSIVNGKLCQTYRTN